MKVEEDPLRCKLKASSATKITLVSNRPFFEKFFLILKITTVAFSTLSWKRSLSYRNQFNDLVCKLVDLFLYDRDLRHKRVNCQKKDYVLLPLSEVHSKLCQTCNPLSVNPTKWSKTLKHFLGKLPTNCLSVFDHFVWLAHKESRWNFLRE